MEHESILIRYGELTTKGKNRMQFVNCLKRNLKKNFSITPIVEFDRMFIDYSIENLNKLNYVYGIQSYSPVIKVKTDANIIENKIVELAELENDEIKFRVTVKRHWKKFEIGSMEFSKRLGHLINKFENFQVSMKDFDMNFEVEIREEFTYIFHKRIMGLGGYPTGVNGRVLHLISGGLDSPVAALELMKRGLHVDFLNFITPPQTDQKTINKVNKIINELIKYQGKAALYRSTYSKLLNLIDMTSNQSYKITLMRRSFYRIANALAEKNGYLAISNGDNLGQVASQTLESINVIQEVSTFPIFRPLLTNDKIETIGISKERNLYDTCIEKANESCELFAPKKPIIKPVLSTVIKLEKELTLLNQFENENINNEIEFLKFDINAE